MRAILEEGLRALGLALEERAVDGLAKFALLIHRWRSRYRCVSQTDLGEIAIFHILDSVAGLLALGGPGRLVDVGSGAGLPGIPLALADPSIEAVLLEPRGKHIEFLERAVEELGIEGRVRPLRARAEEAGRDPSMRESFEIAVARAVGPLPVVLEYALPLLKIGGRFVAYKGPRWGLERGEGEEAARVLGGRLSEVVEFDLPLAGRRRALLAFEKCSPTPPRYPRRPGIPEKRPLPR